MDQQKSPKSPGGDASEHVDSLLKDLRARRRHRGVNERKELSASSKLEPSSVENLVKRRMESRRQKRAVNQEGGLRVAELRLRGEKHTRFDDDSAPPATDTLTKTRAEHEDNKGSLPKGLSTSRWRKISKNVGKIVKQNNGQDAYNFFAATLTGPDDILPSPLPESSVTPLSDAEVVEEKDETSEEIKEKDSSLDSDLVFTYPTYTPQEDRLKAEATFYFKASRSDSGSPLNIQVSEARAVEEGLYIGTTPSVNDSNIRAFKDRISHRIDKGLLWLDESGMLHREKNPLRRLHTRPNVRHNNEDLVEVVGAEVFERVLATQSLKGISKLLIDIGSIQFSHHSLFSSEHVLSTRVEQAFRSYTGQDGKDVEYCEEKITALKNKVAKLKHALSKMDTSSSHANQMCSDIIDCFREIVQLRQKKRQLQEVYYNTLKVLLRHWNSLKALRDHQGYSNTATSLTFKRLETNADEEVAKVSSNINAEVEDRAELHDFEQQFSNNSAKEERYSKDASNSRFEKERVFEELQSFYKKFVRPPGEAQMIPVLSSASQINQSADPLEDLRRIDVDNTQIFIRIFFNDMEVAQTQKRRLNQHFLVQFDESFVVEIFHLPESVKVEIFESSFVTSHLIAQIFLPIPQVQRAQKELSSGVSWMDEFEFSSNKTATYSHAAVGAGFPQQFLSDNAVLLTSGYMRANLFWESEGKEADEVVNLQHADQVKVWTKTGMADSENVKKWIAQSKVDPNDPRNLDFFDLVDSTPSACVEDAFRILELEDVQRFSSDDFFKYDRRFTLLKLRDEGHIRLSGKSIPLYSSEIPTGMWTEVIQSGAIAENELPLLALGDFYSERQAAQNKFLLDITEKVSQISSQRRDLVLSDIVVSDFIPNISSLKATILGLLAPRRPLKPRRQVRKEVAQTSLVSTANIVVRVVRAYNVPLRASATSGVLPDRFTSQGERLQDFSRNLGPVDLSVTSGTLGGVLNEGSVSPFVEVAFEDTVLRTTTSSGANPSWNEDLSMSYELPEKNYSSNKHDKAGEILHISLFDEILVDILEDARERATTIHQRIQKQFMGSIQIPFSTLRQRQKIEGTFQLKVPQYLLGYSPPRSQNNQEVTFEGRQQESPKCQLQLFISLDPPLGAASYMKDVLQSEEDHRHLDFTNQKLKSLQTKYPSRNIFATALDTTGNLVFLSRYIHPQNPPLEILQDATALAQKMEFVAKYVSLIPFFSESLQITREYNVWITSDFFMDLLGGNVEQHSILLCNYFLNCGVQAWLLLGHAIPEGKTAYVLTSSPLPEDVGYWIWNSSTGTHYYQNEPGIPLVSVGCLVNGSNVWANIQEHDHPGLVVFDTRNNKLWAPLLPSEVNWATVQQQDLAYSQTDSYKIKEIQQRFERSARDFIMKGRNRFVTKWNRHCTKALQAILPLFETYPQGASLVEQHQALNEVQSSYNLFGFPMNFRYSDADRLLEAIERTGIHLNESKNAEFGLAIHIHTYPNDILSLWVYIVCMTPK